MVLAVAAWYLIANGKAATFFNIADHEQWKTFGYFVGTLGIGPVAIYLAYLRAKSLAQQVANDRSRLENDRLKLENESKTALDRLALDSKKITDENFTRAMELLGNDHAAVRQGAVFALQRLLGHDDLYSTILRIVCSFIRDKSKNQVVVVAVSGIAASFKTETILSADVEAALVVVRDRKSSVPASVENKKIAARKTGDAYLFDLSNSMIVNMDLGDIDLRYFNVSDCRFIGCNLRRANFEGANLVSTVFGDSELAGANLSKAELARADLSAVSGLAQTQIDVAFGSNGTKLPPGLTSPRSWQ